MVIGQYIHGDSWIYKLDPRTKLISMFLIMSIVFSMRTYKEIGIIVLTIILVSIVSKIPILKVLKSILPLIYLMTFSSIFQVFNNTEGNVLVEPLKMNLTTISISMIVILIVVWMLTKKLVRFKFIYFLIILISIFVIQYYIDMGNMIKNYNITIYQEGVEHALYIVLRLFAIVMLSSVLSITTKPKELTYAISSLLTPFKIFKMPVEEFAMILSITLRMIPTLFIESEKIMKSQASRGVDYTNGSLVKKVNQLTTIIVPMFIISFKKSDNLANAMDARCFVAGQKRTSLREYKLKLVDYICLTTITSILILVIIGIL